MSCHHRPGYHSPGCWDSGDCWPEVPDRLAREYEFGPADGPSDWRRSARRDAPGTPARVVTRLEGRLATLQREIRAIEADLAAIHAAHEPGPPSSGG